MEHVARMGEERDIQGFGSKPEGKGPLGRPRHKKVKQSRYMPGVAQMVTGSKVPRFHDNGTGWW